MRVYEEGAWYTEARDQVLIEFYPTIMPITEIREKMEVLPGGQMPGNIAINSRAAHTLHLRRPLGYTGKHKKSRGTVEATFEDAMKWGADAGMRERGTRKELLGLINMQRIRSELPIFDVAGLNGF